MLLGATTVAWICLEADLFYADLGFSPLYPLVGGIGAAILALSLLSKRIF